MKRNFLTFILFMFLCNSFISADISKGIEIGSATLKLPFAIAANYYDCKDETKKALIFESIYLFLDITNTLLKYKHHSDDVALLEKVLNICNAYCLIVNIIKYSQSDFEFKDDVNDKKNDEDKIKKELEKNNFKKNLYNILKNVAFAGDTISSLMFALNNGDSLSKHIIRKLNSNFNFWIKIFSNSIDNKKVEIYSRLWFVISLFVLTGNVISQNYILRNRQGFDFIQRMQPYQVDYNQQGNMDQFFGNFGFIPIQPPQGTGLDAASEEQLAPIKKLPENVTLEQLNEAIGEVREDVSSCLFCMEDFEHGREVSVVLGCNHVFCRECLDHWRAIGSNACPNCRRNIDINGTCNFVIE